MTPRRPDPCRRSPDYGLINIGFVEEEDGTVSSITIDSYDFSFIAVKKKQ